MIVENIKLARYDRIEDPGHSWLEVPISDVRKIGVLDKITAYSPKKAGFIYLEEDCDMFTFVDAMKSLDKQNPEGVTSPPQQCTVVRKEIYV